MSIAPEWLIVGLGNPGSAHAETRHNIGFKVIDRVGKDDRIEMAEKNLDATYGQGIIKGITVLLVKPLLYMNNSGLTVRRIKDLYSVPSNRILVIHDDIDLEFGRLKIKMKGGHGGHRGIASILNELDVNNFVRLRIGIGRSQLNEAVADFVLDVFEKDQELKIPAILDAACMAVNSIISDGPKAAMNAFNRHRSVLSPNL